MPQEITRRQMLQASALAGVGFWVGSESARSLAASKSPNEKLDIAFVGIGGRGKANIDALSGENVVALCDVDDKQAGDAYQRFPDAKKFYDFRRMFDAMESKIDAVVVSTPDHTHFHPTLWALKRGKHCYTEKPLTHSLWETRTLTTLAAEKKVATQMGCQRHARDNVHRVVEIVRSGAIGAVGEVHTWIASDRGNPDMPKDKPPVPPQLKWDLWIGPAPERPYHSAIAPYEWRWWWDYGTGETGNWGCHILDIPVFALELGYPERVEVVPGPVHPHTTPKSLEVRFDFPARKNNPSLKLHWKQSKELPSILTQNGISAGRVGALFVGSKGMLVADFSRLTLLPEKDFEDYELPPKSIPDSPGFWNEWVLAAKGAKEAPTCNFDYSGPLTELALLSTAGYCAGTSFDWDGEKLEARGTDKIDPFVRREYRKGWEIPI